MGDSELLDYHKEDGTMYLLLGFFLFHAIGAENCPEEKRVGDTCYTRVARADTHQYGCKENCTYKKTNSSDTGLYCFKRGSLQVTECGNFTGGGYQEEGFIKIGVTCGSGVRREFCFLCQDTFDGCEGVSPHPDCLWTISGNCIPNNRECVPPFRPGPGSDGDPNSYCYYFSNTLVNTWEDAENRCRRMNSYLAPVQSQAQQEFIVQVIDPTTSDKIFIGGTSRNNTDLIFYWLLTSTPVYPYTFWGPGEPNFEYEQCMEMVKIRYPQPWMWNNVKCGTPKAPGLRSYVCAYDPK